MIDGANADEERLPLEEIHAYWRKPGEACAANKYTVPIGRSLFLIDILKKYATTQSKVLEIGCNTGRNLAFLHHAGFKRLKGVEISEDAVQNLRKTYRELKHVEIAVSPIEDVVRSISDNDFDVVFTMAVLEHIHDESSWIFADIMRIGRTVITIEDETNTSWKHFRRNYKTVFEGLGLHQVECFERVPGLPASFRCRVFTRPQVSSGIIQDFSSYKGFNPWRELKLHEGHHNRELDENNLSVLKLIAKGLDTHAIATEMRASAALVEVLERAYVSAGWCHFSTNGRQCFPHDDGSGATFRQLIRRTESYLNAKWEGRAKSVTASPSKVEAREK